MPFKDPKQKYANNVAYRANHPSKAAEWSRTYREKHREQVNAHDRERAKTTKRKAEIRSAGKKHWLSLPTEEKQRRGALRLERKMAERTILTGRPRPEICDICGGKHPKRPIMFDHCHQHGHFRGWICWRCNIVFGHVGDNADLLRKMIAYLERNRVNNSPQLTLAV